MKACIAWSVDNPPDYDEPLCAQTNRGKGYMAVNQCRVEEWMTIGRHGFFASMEVPCACFVFEIGRETSPPHHTSHGNEPTPFPSSSKTTTHALATRAAYKDPASCRETHHRSLPRPFLNPCMQLIFGFSLGGRGGIRNRAPKGILFPSRRTRVQLPRRHV